LRLACVAPLSIAVTVERQLVVVGRVGEVEIAATPEVRGTTLSEYAGKEKG
jgi:hypothetical protein